MVKPLQKVRLLRRVNLGSYEFYEIVSEIQDTDENVAWQRAFELLQKAVADLGIKERVEVTRRVRRE